MTADLSQPVLLVALPPRGLSRDTAAAYCGVDAATFDRWRADGMVPGPMPGTRRWDRRAIDVALDRLSGLSDDGKVLPVGTSGPGDDEWLARIKS